MCFADRLSELRKDSGIKQRDLANELKIEYQNLSNYERGLYEPDFDLVVRFAEYYDVSLDYLFGLIDERVSYKRSNTIALPEGISEEAKQSVRDYVNFLL